MHSHHSFTAVQSRILAVKIKRLQAESTRNDAIRIVRTESPAALTAVRAAAEAAKSTRNTSVIKATETTRLATSSLLDCIAYIEIYSTLNFVDDFESNILVELWLNTFCLCNIFTYLFCMSGVIDDKK